MMISIHFLTYMIENDRQANFIEQLAATKIGKSLKNIEYAEYLQPLLFPYPGP